MTHFEITDTILEHIYSLPYFNRNFLDTELNINASDLNNTISTLKNEGYIKEISPGLYRITGEGKNLIDNGGYGFKKYQEGEVEKLNFQKLELDIKNAERVHKSYPLTRFLAWFGAITGFLALVIKLLEDLKIF